MQRSDNNATMGAGIWNPRKITNVRTSRIKETNRTWCESIVKAYDRGSSSLAGGGASEGSWPGPISGPAEKRD